MIVEFSIANTFSIKDEQTVSFEAVGLCKATADDASVLSDAAVQDDSLSLTAPARLGSHCVRVGSKTLLKLACIYGANASGKTNILTALRFYVRFAVDSFTNLKPSEPTHFVPFRFDEQTARDPGFFNLVFYMKDAAGRDVLYTYELLLCATHVVKEKLSYTVEGGRQEPAGAAASGLSTAASSRTPAVPRAKLVFERLGDGGVKWGSGITGAKKLIADMTRPNCTVLSTGAQAQHPLFSALYDFFNHRFGGLTAPGALPLGREGKLSHFTLQRIEDDASYKEKVIGMFNASDIAPISDIRIETQEVSDALLEQLPPEMQDALSLYPERAKTRRALFVHKYDGHEYELPVGLESAGTLRMLELIAPLSDVIKSHAFVLVDELELSLHEELVETFLRLFLEASEDSQLLFTTHNQDLLDTGLLRDDEIWFCYKTENGNSVYNAITDYAGITAGISRKKLYQAGKFGALPLVDVSALMELFSAKKDR